ncbi:MAG: GIY-YIG nuclease family protein [SAR202 cluster bacterium]|nr:GIY-YIG nuclease family protein [SAR202 cluster bacterium]
MPFFVYVLKNPDDRYYIGQTSDLELRLRRHNEGRAFWTKTRVPWTVLASKEFDTRGEAMAEERRLKRLKNREVLDGIVAQW